MESSTHIWHGYWRWSYGERPHRRATVVYCVSCGEFEDAYSQGFHASDNFPCKRGPMNEWVVLQGNFLSYRSKEGYATVESLPDGRWRWEGYPVDRLELDRDAWWGITSNEDEAKRAAERYLSG